MPIETRHCQNCQQLFEITPEDGVFYTKLNVPPPTWCPKCRMQRRCAWRNEHRIYRRKSDFTGKEIFSQYDQAAGVKAYELSIWHSDTWNPMEYGRPYDFSRPFFSQLAELFYAVPQRALDGYNNENSDYCSNSGNLKDCYLLFNSGYCERSFYGHDIMRSYDCVDNSHILNSELSYECVMSLDNYRAFFCDDSGYNRDVYFLKDCLGCSDCFGCVNLRNKKYHIFNQPYSKEAYFEKLKSYDFGSYRALEQIKRDVAAFWLRFPRIVQAHHRNQDVSGEYLIFSKNVKESWIVNGAEDSKWCQFISAPVTRDCYDYTIWGEGAELVYECIECGLGAYNLKFCFNCWPSCRDLEYCIACSNTSNCFGCVGLKGKTYCIFNVQYTKQEYEATVAKIKTQMDAVPFVDRSGRTYRYGEFLPVQFSPHPYNDSLAHEIFPCSRDEVQRTGGRWLEIEEKQFQPTMQSSAVPDHIKDIPDSIVDELILCKAWDDDRSSALLRGCTKVFRILPKELAFYRKAGLAIPRYCVNCRLHTRLGRRNPFTLHTRQCYCFGTKGSAATVGQGEGTYRNHGLPHHTHGDSERCSAIVSTSFSQEQPEIVYCNQCYLTEVV